MEIDDYGHHKEKKPGEIFAGFLTVQQFQNGRFWSFERLGLPINKRRETGNRPWFILESEAWERGWIINRNRKFDMGYYK